MSNEINYSLAFTVGNTGYQYIFNQQGAKTQSALGASAEVVSVGTSPQTLNTTGVTTLGWATFQNLGTHFITIGCLVSSTYYPFLKLKGGDSAVCRLVPGMTVQAQADTAATNLSYCIQND